jgi:hypothetical protein
MFYRSQYDSCIVTSSQEAKGAKSIYTRRSLHQVLFSHPQSLVFSVLSTEQLYILTSEHLLTSVLQLTFTHLIVGRNISCHCMSHTHLLARVTPASLPPLNLTTYLNNYLLLRSFQLNFSKGTLTHLSVYHPAFNNTLVAGDITLNSEYLVYLIR